jgi:hypothetical protein
MGDSSWGRNWLQSQEIVATGIVKAIKMKEVTSIVIDSIQVRIVESEESKWCEIYESGNWSRIPVIKLHELSFDKRIYDWLSKYYYSPNYLQKIPDDNSRISFYETVINYKDKALSSKLAALLTFRKKIKVYANTGRNAGASRR